jgi:hypothetical protein
VLQLAVDGRYIDFEIETLNSTLEGPQLGPGLLKYTPTVLHYFRLLRMPVLQCMHMQKRFRILACDSVQLPLVISIELFFPSRR